MRLSSRRSDDADVIRARLRALLEDRDGRRGWVPEDDEAEDDLTDPSPWHAQATDAGGPALAADGSEAELPRGIGRHRAPDRATRWDPGRGGAWSLWLAGLVTAALLIAWTWWDRPRIEPVPANPAAATPIRSGTEPPTPPVGEVAETSSTVVVSVVGLVARPGLVTLASGSRVAEAIEAAGGLLPGTDPATVNLAAVVTDGEQIAVGVPALAAGSAGAPGAGTSGGRVNLNTAGPADLDTLPGIGPVLAQRIVEYRTRQGPFRTVDQLDDVPGIGPAIATELAELVIL
ncbi:MAG: ComEA family DNA-binding protein [Blastococcus sp.]